MKRMRALVLLLFVFPCLPRAWAAEAAPPAEDPDKLVATALSNNPELSSSQARWRMFAAKAGQAAALEDPMLMFRLQNLVAREPFSFDKDPQTGKVIGVSQQLPFWGKRAVRQEVARHEAESYRWAIEERKLELARMVKESCYQLYAVDKSLEIVARNLQVLSDFVSIAELKYAAGQGLQQDIFKAGLEKSKMLDMQISLTQKRRSLEANINYLLSRPGETPVGRIADFSLPRVSLGAAELAALAQEKRPQLQSLNLLTSKGKAAQRLAELESYPDFNLSLEYMFRERSMDDPGFNMFSLGLAFNLPFQQERRQAMLAEAVAETSMAAAEILALKNNISYVIGDILAHLAHRRHLVDLYAGGIIPQAEQSLESAVIGYRVNKVDFMTLLDGRMNLFNYQRELYESQAEYMMKLAQLEAVVGADPAAGQAVRNAVPAVAAPPPAKHSHHH